MLKWTILLCGLMAFNANIILGQQESDLIKWHPTGKHKNLGGSIFQTVTADDQSVIYHKIEAGLRLKASDIIVADHTFTPVKTVDVMPGSETVKSSTGQMVILSVRNGKMLVMDSNSGYAKGLISLKISCKVLDMDFNILTKPVPLKQPDQSYIPVGMVDLANPFTNKPYQLIENENGVILAYISSESAEANLQIGLAKFDVDFNLISNHLHEIELPANRLIDFRLSQREIDGKYYVILKETLAKKPATKIERPSSSSLDYSRFLTNEEKKGVNRLYQFNETGLSNSYDIKGEIPTPTLCVLANGNVLIAGMKTDESGNRFTGVYSVTFDAELNEISKSEQSFSEMYSNEMETIKSKEKGMSLNIRHLKIYEVEDKLILNVELFGSKIREVTSGSKRSYEYTLLVGDNILFQIDKKGVFTGLISTISKSQLEFGSAQYYSGSFLFVKEDVLQIYFNDRKDNVGSAKKERWSQMDNKRGDSVIREIKVNSDLKTVSDRVVSSESVPVVMAVNTAHFSNDKLVLYGTDFGSTYGAVVK